MLRLQKSQSILYSPQLHVDCRQSQAGGGFRNNNESEPMATILKCDIVDLFALPVPWFLIVVIIQRQQNFGTIRNNRPRVGMVWGQTEDMGIGHGSCLQVLECVETVSVFQPHPRLVVETRLNQGGEEREGKGGRAWEEGKKVARSGFFFLVLFTTDSLKMGKFWCVRLGFCKGEGGNRIFVLRDSKPFSLHNCHLLPNR